ncbi:hypothetical protein Tco_1507647 [Tanacetum coccineum]
MSSDSASSEVTYTSISSHGDPLAWAVDFFGLQEPNSPEAAPASPDYVSGPEELEQAPLSPDYVPGPEYPEYLAPSDEEDHADYPADGGDDEPSNDDDDTGDEDEEPFEDEEDNEEEEEHLAPADSPAVPVIDPVERLLALPIPPPSPLTPLSSPLPQIPSPPLPPLPSSLHLPPPLPTSLFIPPVDRREDTSEAELPPRKRLCLTALTSRYEVDPVDYVEEVAPTTLEGVNDKVTELAAVQEQDTQDIYAVIEDT